MHQHRAKEDHQDLPGPRQGVHQRGRKHPQTAAGTEKYPRRQHQTEIHRRSAPAPETDTQQAEDWEKTKKNACAVMRESGGTFPGAPEKVRGPGAPP